MSSRTSGSNTIDLRGRFFRVEVRDHWLNLYPASDQVKSRKQREKQDNLHVSPKYVDRIFIFCLVHFLRILEE